MHPTRTIRRNATPHTPRHPARWKRPRHPYPAEPDTPHHRIALFGHGQPHNNPTSSHRHLRTRHLLTPPPAETAHRHRRLEPSPQNLLRRTTHHRRTGRSRHAMKGKRLERWRVRKPPLKPLPHPTTNNHNSTSPRRNPVTPCPIDTPPTTRATGELSRVPPQRHTLTSTQGRPLTNPRNHLGHRSHTPHPAHPWCSPTPVPPCTPISAPPVNPQTRRRILKMSHPPRTSST